MLLDQSSHPFQPEDPTTEEPIVGGAAQEHLKHHTFPIPALRAASVLSMVLRTSTPKVDFSPTSRMPPALADGRKAASCYTSLLHLTKRSWRSSLILTPQSLPLKKKPTRPQANDQDNIRNCVSHCFFTEPKVAYMALLFPILFSQQPCET